MSGSGQRRDERSEMTQIQDINLSQQGCNWKWNQIGNEIKQHCLSAGHIQGLTPRTKQPSTETESHNHDTAVPDSASSMNLPSYNSTEPHHLQPATVIQSRCAHRSFPDQRGERAYSLWSCCDDWHKTINALMNSNRSGQARIW
jgi:hypothetical protein